MLAGKRGGTRVNGASVKEERSRMSLGRLGDEMASAPNEPKLPYSGRIPSVPEQSPLTTQQALFADLVASGMSYVEAAETAGFGREYGRHLSRDPFVRQRIDDQIGDPNKARTIADYTLAVIRTRDAVGNDAPGTENWRANMEFHLKALDKLARVCGWIVERKQVAKVSASMRLKRDELDAIQADLERLAPGATGMLERLGRAPRSDELRAIAAGEVIDETTGAKE
jgi:hypothetical protein